MENMGSEKRNSLRKPMRRRSHTRQASQDCVINMAEARREIAHALHIHRSSSSSSSTSSSSSCITNRVFGGSSQYCYSLMESMPLPEPIWSTTAPSILAAPPQPAAFEALEFEWGENQAAAYTWWLGFLQTLDGKKMNEEPLGNSRVLFGQESSRQGDQPPFLDDSDQIQSSSPDEWLMFPTTEDQGEMVIPHENVGF